MKILDWSIALRNINLTWIIWFIIIVFKVKKMVWFYILSLTRKGIIG